VVHGGLGRHVHALAEAQAQLGHDVTVLTVASPDAPRQEIVNGVRIVRATPAPPQVPFDVDHLLAWALAMNHELTHAGLQHLSVSAPGDLPEVWHGHDWLVAHAVTNLAAWTDSRHPSPPIVVTMHATESGRHQGWLTTPLSRSIHAIEEWLVCHASGIIACSTAMSNELQRLFAIPEGQITVIPNGIDITERRRTKGTQISGSGGRTAMIVYCGRLEWEKGVDTLLHAIAQLRRSEPHVRLVIAGEGGKRTELEELTRALRIRRRVTFAGWLPRADLDRVIAEADVMVVPSRYEPFGLVALEGAALGTPLVLARTGGLAEFSGVDETAKSFAPGDSTDLAHAISDVLNNSAAAASRARTARRRLRERHRWSDIARSTVAYYASLTRE
jgi:glycogen synthase